MSQSNDSPTSMSAKDGGNGYGASYRLGIESTILTHKHISTILTSLQSFPLPSAP